jgi:hypothetical protein
MTKHKGYKLKLFIVQQGLFHDTDVLSVFERLQVVLLYPQLLIQMGDIIFLQQSNLVCLVDTKYV